MTSLNINFTLSNLTFIYKTTGLYKKMLYTGKNIYKLKEDFLFIDTYVI